MPISKSALLTFTLTLASCGYPPGTISDALQRCGPNCFNQPTTFQMKMQEYERLDLINRLDALENQQRRR